MTDKKLRFAIFGNEYQAKKSASIQKIIAVLQKYKAEIFIDDAFLTFLRSENIEIGGVTPFVGDDFSADFVISMGGDGTLLKAAAKVGEKATPILGVNMGRLGFLSDVLPSEIDNAISAIHNGNYDVEQHAVIQVDTEGRELCGCRFALNDIALLKRDSASMIGIHTTIDNEYVATYQADGLIASTPTGSTAYSLSNGGPIMVPNADILCLTPVAPHSLNIRPIVISGNSVITLKVESRSHNFLIAIDGRSETLSEGTIVTIKKAKHSVNIVKLQNKHYFSTLREKMMWGLDAR